MNHKPKRALLLGCYHGWLLCIKRRHGSRASEFAITAVVAGTTRSAAAIGHSSGGAKGSSEATRELGLLDRMSPRFLIREATELTPSDAVHFG